MITILIFFLTVFLPKFLMFSAIIELCYFFFQFIKCYNRDESLNEIIDDKHKFYIYLSITYLLTLIFI